MRTLTAGLAVVAAMALTAGAASAATTTETVVTNTVNVKKGENGSAGWWFNRDPENTTPFAFSSDEAKIGDGSLFVPPIGTNGPDKFIGELFSFAPITSDTAFTFDYKLATGRDSDFYLNVYTNLPGTPVDNFYDCRFSYGAKSAPDGGGWRTVGTTVGAPSVTARGGATCPSSLADMPAGSTVRTFAINVGQSNASDAGTSGYVDNVVVTLDGDTTVYDFEVPPISKSDCRKGGYADFGFANQGGCIAYLQANAQAGK